MEHLQKTPGCPVANNLQFFLKFNNDRYMYGLLFIAYDERHSTDDRDFVCQTS